MVIFHGALKLFLKLVVNLMITGLLVLKIEIFSNSYTIKGEEVMNEAQKIEISMEGLKRKISTMKNLQRLSENEDFKELILEEFCKRRALAMVDMAVAPGFSDETNKEYIKNQLIAVGSLNTYMHNVLKEGEMAIEALAESEAEHNMALREE